MNKIYDDLFKIDTKGKTRVWRMEQQGFKTRTIAGINGGKLVTSGWTHCEATNVGRSNERDPVKQATFEVEAEYEHNLTRDYHRTIEGAGGGAHFFEPMLAEKYKKFEVGYAQPKLDGVRCIAKKDGLWSRQGKQIKGAAHIVRELKPLFAANPELILDGELYNHDYKDDFNSILSAVRKEGVTPEQIALAEKLVQYHVYDIPWHKGNFSERHIVLQSLLDLELSPLSKIECVVTHRVVTQQQYDELHELWIVLGYEGSMHRLDAPYEQKRSKVLKKRKEFFDEEYPISKIMEGDGNWGGCGKVVEFIMPGDRRTESGDRPKAGVKGTQEFTAQLLIDKDEYEQVTIRYTQLTPAGIPRNPVATKFHGKKREF